MSNKKINIDLSLNMQNAQKSLSSLKNNFNNVSRDMSKTFEKSFTQGTLKDALNYSNKLSENITGIKNAFTETNAEIKNMTNSLNFAFGGQETSQNPFRKILEEMMSPKPKSDPLGGIFGGLGFNTGGIVPGSFSQAVPATLHGSEMVLNPSQQANLFAMLNSKGQGGTGSKAEPNYVYAPQIKTGASASEVFDVLQRHSTQFFSLVADGVQSSSNLRNAVRSA